MSLAVAPRRLTSRIPPLLRETAFRRYWSAQSISLVGDQISSIALPLAAVLVLRAGPAEMGYLSALIWLPSLLFALHAGAWVDRRGHRRATMIAADLAQLFAVAFAAGTLSIFFTVSDAGLFVALVPGDQYVDGNSLIYQSRALAAVAGPSVGGLLVQALSAPFALAADALSFLGSAFFLSRIRPAEPAPDQDDRRGALSAGARFIWSSPILRPSLACVSVINFFSFMFMALFVLYAIRALHVRPGLLGLVLGAGAIGGVLGSVLTRRIAARAGLGRAYLIGCIVYPAPVLLVPLAAGPRLLILGMLLAAEFLSGFGVMILDISIGTILAAVVPDPLRARVSGAFMAINYGTRPVGSLAGGAAGALLGLHPALWIAAAGGTLGFLCLLPSPMPRFRLTEPGRASSGSRSTEPGRPSPPAG
jgi:MFS family permease